MRNGNATYKGLITGLIMLAISLAIFYYRKSFENGLQYITYAVYVAGIVWAMVTYSNMAHAIRSFRNYFSQGFKCFIVVTLVMVSFTYIFIKSDPSMKEEMAKNYRIGLEKQGNLTPAEMDKNVENAKEYYITMLTSAAIFGYLVIGALVTAVTAGVLIKVKGSNIDQNHTSFTGTKI